MLHNDQALRVVIPARLGSSRLPNKPLVDLAGKPMVVRVYETVRTALPATNIVVAVDDAKIMSVLDARNIPAVMTRTDHESGTDRAAEVARLLDWGDDTVLINVQGDEPLIPGILLRAFEAFCLEQDDMSIATIAVPVESHAQIHDPNIVKLTASATGKAITFSRAPIPFNRDVPIGQWPLKDYFRHVGIYAYKNDILQKLTRSAAAPLEKTEKLEQLRAQWLGIPIQIMHWHEAPPHGVDTPEDAARVSRIFQEMTP